MFKRLIVVIAVVCSAVPGAAMSVTLTGSTASPAPVGTLITWNAEVSGAASTNLWYRFRARYRGTVFGACPAGGAIASRRRCAPPDFAVVRDYGPLNTLSWTAGGHEGDYEVEVSARDNDTGEVAVSVAAFQFTARASDGVPAICATANPLVFLYSAPPCPAGSRMRVEFLSPGGFLQSTSARDCDGLLTMNFYVAGLRPETRYFIQHVVEGDTRRSAGPVLTATTPGVSLSYGPYTVLQPPRMPLTDGILLHGRFGTPVATDLMGNIIWYYSGDISFLSRPEPGGLFLGWFEDQSVDPAHQFLREFDLAGTTIRETNAARVSEQLAAIGMHSINAFHHEVRGLPDGGILALAATERILTDIQGAGPVDVLGDMIVVLDRNLRLRWAWDSFDHLDPHRFASLNETCTRATNGCAPIYLADRANDWVHGNSLELTADGNILYSARHQDWLIKIDYRNGQGSGDILWRMGAEGDFDLASSDFHPWFSHQHDANIDGAGLLTVFDNGNVRYVNDQASHSRGQVLRIDEQNHTVEVVLNADLGAFSTALGSAQLLPNGNYHFNLGFVTTDNTAYSLEVDPSGTIVYDMHVGEPEYRTFRMGSLYTP